jgi:hypothetical protein
MTTREQRDAMVAILEGAAAKATEYDMEALREILDLVTIAFDRRKEEALRQAMDVVLDLTPLAPPDGPNS